MTEIKNSDLYGFSLKTSNKKLKFYTRNEELQKEWINNLKRYCVLDNFDDKYELDIKLGIGNCATVYKAIEKLTKKAYAVSNKIAFLLISSSLSLHPHLKPAYNT